MAHRISSITQGLFLVIAAIPILTLWGLCTMLGLTQRFDEYHDFSFGDKPGGDHTDCLNPAGSFSSIHEAPYGREGQHNHGS